jgi:hypothetical protein
MAESAWLGECHYRMLSFHFGVRWNSQVLWGAFSQTVEQFDSGRRPAEDLDTSFPLYSLVEVPPPGPLRYRVLFGETLVSGSDLPGPVLDVLFWHLNTEITRRSGDFLLVHAGAVATPAGAGLLLPAPSGHGKSTLVAGLVRAGFGYLSDEAGAVDPVSRKVYPYPKALSLGWDVLDTHFPDLLDGADRQAHQRHVHPDRLRPGAIAEPCAVRFVIAHRYRAGAPTSITPISLGSAAMELGRNAMNLSVYRERALTLLSDLASGAVGYRMIHGNLYEAVEAIRRVTGSDLDWPIQVEKTPSSLEAKSPS